MTDTIPFSFQRFDQLTFSDHSWLVQGYIEAGSLSMLFGEPACGKSFIALAIAACVASGCDWNGNGVRKGAVFYIAGEGYSGIKKRLMAWEIDNGIALTGAPLFFSQRPAVLSDQNEVKQIAREVETLSQLHGEPALVVIDTLARNIGDGDENSTRDIAKLIGNLDREIRTAFNCAVMLVHHCGHEAGSRARGSSSIKGAMDAEFRLTVERDGRRRLSCTKMKDHDISSPLMLDAKMVELPYRDSQTNKNLTSLVLIRSASQESSLKLNKKRLSAPQQIVLEALKTALDHSVTKLPVGLSELVGKAVYEDEWKKQAYSKQISNSQQVPAKLAAFTRAKQALQKLNYVGTRDGYYWLITDSSITNANNS